MKSAIKACIPPVLIELIGRLQRAESAYRTYDEALAQCGRGYASDELAAVVVEKTKIYRDSLRASRSAITDFRGATLAHAIGLSATGDSLNCLDFGGAAGAHFFFAQHLFRQKIDLVWHVVETTAMAASAEELSGDGFKFFTDIKTAAAGFAGRIDLIFTSGALQYMRDPEATLSQLTELGARRLFVTRIPLSDAALERRVFGQRSKLSHNGQGPLPKRFVDRTVIYPCTICPRQKIEAIVAERYDVDFAFVDDRDTYHIGRKSIPLYGFFGSQKAVTAREETTP